MPRTAEPPPRQTVADLLRSLGDIPPERVRLTPAPGTATEADVLDIQRREKRTCEIVDGVLVEKTMGWDEADIAVTLITLLNTFVRRHRLGVVNGPDGTLRLPTGLLRVPDVTFVSWGRLPGRRKPKQPVPVLTLDLAVEVISRGNSKREMERKLREYFEAGTRLVWFVYPRTRTVRVYTDPKRFTTIGEDGTLDGGDVLPGFRLALGELFGDEAWPGGDG